MKKLFILLAFIPVLAFGQVAVKNLPNGASISNGDFTICDQSGVTNKCPFSAALAYIQQSLIVASPTPGDCTKWITSLTIGDALAPCGSGGGLSSVGLSTSLPWLSITNSPLTANGTIALSATTGQVANEFLATPNGSGGPVGLRGIASGDIPPINLASLSNGGVTGILPVANFCAATGASSSTFCRGDGTWATPAGTGTVTTSGSPASPNLAAFSAAAVIGPASGADILAYWTTGTCSSSTYLRGDLACETPAGAGTVTSVAATVPGFLSISGSPVTASGTLAISYSGTALPTANGGTGATSLAAANIAVTTVASTWTALQTFTNSDICLLGSSTGCTTLTSANTTASNFTLTAPAVTDTLVTLAATQPLTNKSIAASEVNSGTLAAAQIPAALTNTTSVNGTSIPASATLIESIATGISPLGTAAITSGSCATAVTATATGLYTSDVIDWQLNGDPTSTVGYVPSSSGILTIYPISTPNTANFKVCNNTSASITPGAISLSWYVNRSTAPLVAFVQIITPWGGGATPQVSGSFTPVTYSSSDVMLGHAFGSPAGTISASGTSGTWNVLSQLADGSGNQFAALSNTSFSNVAQTATWAQVGATALFGRAWEYTHTSSVTGSTLVRTAPGTTPGAVVGTSVSVPNGGVLFCSVTNTTGGGITNFNGTSRGSSGTTYTTEELTNTTGSATSMQCAFTATVGTDAFDIEQWVLSP